MKHGTYSKDSGTRYPTPHKTIKYGVPGSDGLSAGKECAVGMNSQALTGGRLTKMMPGRPAVEQIKLPQTDGYSAAAVHHGKGCNKLSHSLLQVLVGRWPYLLRRCPPFVDQKIQTNPATVGETGQ